MRELIDMRVPVVVLTLIILNLVACAERHEPGAADYLPDANDAVTAYGMTLDQDAAPEQTAWALLMAARDDVRAPLGTPRAKELLKLQCSLANVELLRDSSAADRGLSKEAIDDLFFEIVKGWASALNYYTEFFDGDYQAAKARMATRSTTDTRLPKDRQEVRVVDYVLTANQPDSPQGLDRGVTIHFLLSKTQKGYWRVYKIILGPPPATTNS